MQQSDKAAFADLWNLIRSTYGQAPLGALATELEFEALAEYRLDTIRCAFLAHKKDPKEGKFLPTTAHIIAQIEGPQPDECRVMPDAYKEFNPSNAYALPALPLSPEEIARNEQREAEKKAAAAEERQKVREMLKTKGLIKAMPGSGKERKPLPPLSEPAVRTVDGKLQFKCDDGRWV